jgi:hypothetical protein
MNSLSERIKKLEDSQTKSHVKFESVKEKALQNRLVALREEEQNKKMNDALEKLKKAFFDGLNESTLPYEHLSFVEFAVRFVEVNAKNFANLLDTKLSSGFKKSLAISLLEEVDDSIDYSIMIDYVCSKVFPKKKSLLKGK